MTLITSISGIRGTIGGKPGQGLTPLDVVKYTAAYGIWIQKGSKSNHKCSVVIGRDARLSGPMVQQLVAGTLVGLGIDVIDVGLSTTPTVEMAVTHHKADGGIILTASHNPIQWNALKLLNNKGEFLSGADGEKVLALANSSDFEFAQVEHLGKTMFDPMAIERHIDAIVSNSLVDVNAIQSKNFKVVLDAVNSSGGVAIPKLLKALGVDHTIELYCDPTGHFPHNPEPLPEHLTALSESVVSNKADLGIVVDPDVDRLALVNEDGSMFGEEYTLVAVADHVLKYRKGDTVSNMSSTRALRDVTEAAGGKHHASAVGEVNVVAMMKSVNAPIGGEGNGGVIYPELHYGRDALAGIALFLTHLAKSGLTCKKLRASYPDYFISKNKIELTPDLDVDSVLASIKEKYAHQPINDLDGVKIEFGNEWVHLRKSNTEPIIRIYSESQSEATANELAKRIMNDIQSLTLSKSH
ncbi:MAG: phosphoglucosamine mutase [Bacteroidota bacterium]